MKRRIFLGSLVSGFLLSPMVAGCLSNTTNSDHNNQEDNPNSTYTQGGAEAGSAGTAAFDPVERADQYLNIWVDGGDYHAEAENPNQLVGVVNGYDVQEYSPGWRGGIFIAGMHQETHDVPYVITDEALSGEVTLLFSGFAEEDQPFLMKEQAAKHGFRGNLPERFYGEYTPQVYAGVFPFERMISEMTDVHEDGYILELRPNGANGVGFFSVSSEYF